MLEVSMTNLTTSLRSSSKYLKSGASGLDSPFAAMPRLRAAVSMLLLSVTLLSCTTNRKKIIAVVPKATSHLFWVSIHAGAMAAGHDLDVNVRWNGQPSATDCRPQSHIGDARAARHRDGIAHW